VRSCPEFNSGLADDVALVLDGNDCIEEVGRGATETEEAQAADDACDASVIVVLVLDPVREAGLAITLGRDG